MATIEKRDTGYRARVRKGGVSRSATFRTKAQAQAWAVQQEAELQDARLGKLPRKTFGDLLARYRDEVSPGKRGERWERLRINAILTTDPIAKVWLQDLGRDDFAAWRDRRLTVVQPGSVLREWTLLSAACRRAVDEWQWLHENPLSKVSRPVAPKARTKRVTDDEIAAIKHVTGYHDGELVTQMQRVCAAMLFAIETAMRAGEICGLKPVDVDLRRRVAHLAKTKNGHARDVPLSKEALRLLAQLPLVDGGGVFGLSAALLDALFRKAKAQALIEGLHFHDTRREALTRLAAKVDVMTLAKISGHRDLRILLNTYYSPDMASVVDKLG